MKKLMMKARAGVTLVELLVVILIVTILSVSMLPLLQPFVVEAQYAAEAIPVIANMRTKIGLYVYDKGHLPYDQTALPTAGKVETWMISSNDQSGTGDIFNPAIYDFTSQDTKRTAPVDRDEISDSTQKGGHIANLLDIDYQDLKGKRSKPLHYQYMAICTNDAAATSYAVGCFGDGNGLKAGTGYAVCELNFTAAGRKLIGTWKRYKSYNDEAGAIVFSSNDAADDDTGKVLDCYIPVSEEVEAATTAAAVQDIVNAMVGAGWEF